jgi:RNA polymerase sigma-70 factor (ECF subfamily)
VVVDQRELVERAMGGDHDAFAVLAGRFVARLDAAARLILRDPEAFIGAWRNLPTLRDPDRFEAWLRRLVVRSCINAVRHRGRQLVEVELTPLHEPSISDIASIVADRELLDVALKQLRPEARAVVVLHFYLGLPLPDVAESLAIPVGTAKSRLHRAIAEMRSSIDADLTPASEHVAGGQLA